MNALLNNDAETLFVLAHRLRPLFSMLGVKASQGPLEWLEKKKGSGNIFKSSIYYFYYKMKWNFTQP